MLLTEAHRALLSAQGISDTIIDTLGVYSVTSVDAIPEGHQWAGARAIPSIAFPWRTPSGDSFIQLRPDTPILATGDIRARKYLWPAGKGSAIAEVRKDIDSDVVLLVEGTKQSLAAASYLEEGSIYGIAGCRSWSTEGVPINDLDIVDGKQVYVLFDADIASNPDVWDAASKFSAALLVEGAVTINYCLLPAGRKAGLDDVLGSKAPEKRKIYLERLMAQSVRKLPKRPKRIAKTSTPLTVSEDRPLIIVNADRLTVIDALTEALKSRWDGDTLFNYGDVITQRNTAALCPVDKAVIHDLIAQSSVTCRIDGKGNTLPEWPDPQSVMATLSRARTFTPLSRLVQSPFVRPDGSICQKSGYDSATETYLLLAEEMTIDVPECPSSEDVAEALKLLTVEWLGDLFTGMPGDADRANTLALILTPLIRGLVPLAPLAIVNGLQMGVGKNLLADLVSLLSTGLPAQPLPYSAQDDEVRKVITAAFRAGKTLQVFDEAHNIEGASLARAITAITYTDRILGVSNNAEFPNKVTWMALGNNVSVNGDMSRRVYIIRLAPQGENPQDRNADDFRHPDIRGWTAQHRSELLQAALTLIRAWFVEGQPQDPVGRSMGSFAEWGGIIGGVLATAGVTGFLGNLQQWRSESDYDRAYWLAHLQWLRRVFGDEEFTVAAVIAAMNVKKEPPVEHPPKLTDTEGKDYARVLGQAYGRQKEKIVEGLQLTRTAASPGHGNRWQVREIVADSPRFSKVLQGSPRFRRDIQSLSDVSAGQEVRGDRGDRDAFARVANSLFSNANDNVKNSTGAGLPGYTQSPHIPPPAETTEGEEMLHRNLGEPVTTLENLGESATISRSPFDRFRGAAASPAPPICPDCDTVMSLVPPHYFWYACHSCTPDTFKRA
jgi:hypothetical protein